MIIDRPPMGWNSWNTFGEEISDAVIRETAKLMSENGMLEAGYNYVVIDDCWALRERDENGRLVPDPVKFPHGMRDLADYIHGLGMKFGMYSCVGEMTCASYPGSYDHEFIDAETLAEWQVDFLKYDYCFRPSQTPGHLLYKRMGLALANCGRDILFNACNWGKDDACRWIKETGAHMWRSTDDIFDDWNSVKRIAMQQTELQPYNSSGCYNDMDMLIVGMNGKGNVAQGGCTEQEYRLHFSLWALLASPLFLGCDVRNLTDDEFRLLTNPKLIAVNQDRGGYQPFMINALEDRPIWARMLENGDYAIGLFNLSDTPYRQYFSIADLGLSEHFGKKFEMENLWTGETSVLSGAFSRMLEPHDCEIFRAKLI